MKVGDIVYLKSGSPALTVDQITTTSIVVKWFSGGQIQKDNVPEEALIITDPRASIEKAEKDKRAEVFPG